MTEVREKGAAPKWVFTFGGGRADGSAADKALLGGKGAHLAEMSRLGLPVPPGFTISTDVCAAYYEHGRKLPDALKPMVDEALTEIGELAGAHFGDVDNPLLVSVRSGGRASMPGMMDTVLNLGLNDQTVEGLARVTEDRRFAYDTYRRFIQMYADVVLGIDHGLFEEILESYKNLKGFELDPELGADDWVEIVTRFKALVETELDAPFPQDMREQLWGAISAVFGSWHNARAIAYRRLHDIPDEWGTAVNIQTMVFGNKGDNSATGVVFTRNPSTGENVLFGEFLLNAQGEDVVAGLRTPQPLTKKERAASSNGKQSLEALFPEAFAELKASCEKLERHFRDLQDIEFTVQEGELFMLQTRAGKRTTQAGLKIAVDMAQEGIITASDSRSERTDDRARQRLARIAWCRDGRDCVRRRRGGAHEGARAHRDPGAYRNLAGRCARHACGRRDRHHARRHDEPRGCRGPRHGTSLHRRRCRGAYRPRTRNARSRGRHAPQSRRRYHRRRNRSAYSGPGEYARAGAVG
jgi:pyruvate,orthophosphate dikinase